MANPDRARGLVPVGTLSGAPWQGLIRHAKLSDAEGTDVWDDVFIGDPIAWDISESTNEVKPAFVSSGDTDVLGVCVGAGYTPVNTPANEFGMFNVANLEKNFADASEIATSTVWVYYVPTADMIFEIQTASAITVQLGKHYDWVLANGSGSHGSQTTGLSSVELTSDSQSHMIAMAFPEYPDNTNGEASFRVHVTIADRAYFAAAPDLA